MSDYQYGQFIDQTDQEIYDPKKAEDSVRKSILQSFTWMGIGLLLSGLTAAVVCLTSLKNLIYGTPFIPIILLFVQLGLTIAFTASINSADSTKLKVMFLAYCFTMGLTLSSIGLTYDLGTIFAALLVSALYFGCLVFIGYTTKKDLSGFGMPILAALIALLIGNLVCMFLGYGDILPIMLLGLLLFTGITIYDVQKLKVALVSTQGMPVQQEKLSIYFALELYLDFMNIFLYVLRFLGRNSSKN